MAGRPDPVAPGPRAGEPWRPERLRVRPLRLVVNWVVSALALLGAAAILPGVGVEGFWGALLAALLIAILNALLPPVLAALRLPLTALFGFLLILVLDALMLSLTADIAPDALSVDGFGWALLAALAASAISVALHVAAGLNDDDVYTLRVIRRIARRTEPPTPTDVPGIVYLEIDGLALPVLRRAMRDGNAPEMARWLATGSHHLVPWETDLSSQTGASQAGILLGSNADIP